MLINYLKTGLRHLRRHKLNSIINVGGLALGMAIAILIGLWVNDELTFDHYHKNHNNIAQVYKWTAQKWLPYPLAVELKENYHQPFKQIVTVLPRQGYNTLAVGENVFKVEGQYVDPRFLDLFTLEMIEGDWNALNDPYSVVISESTAKKFFGNSSAMDKLMKFDNTVDVKVTGVFRDMPHNSEFYQREFFVPWRLLEIQQADITANGWDNHFVYIYVELNPGVTMEDASQSILKSEAKIIKNVEYMPKEAAENSTVWLHPMWKWHLYSTFDWQAGTFSNGPIQFVYLMSVIGLFVVILACINFMNLATAQSEKRMREVGVRKAIGSLRSQLVGQFYSESFIVVFVSFALSIVIAAISLPAFNDLASKQMTMPWLNLTFWTGSILLMSLVALVAGSYPALYLSSFKPSVVLKGNTKTSQLATLFRRLLVTTQFSISIMLIIATIFVYKQIVFAKDREVGYSRGGLLMIPARGYSSKYDVIRERILSSGVATDVAGAGGRVTSAWSQGGGFQWDGPDHGSEKMLTTTFGTLDVTPPFGKTVGWEIISGRDFDENIVSDSSAFIINEAAAKAMGFTDATGEVVHWKSKWHANVDKDFRIIGVVKDMVMKSPYDQTMPAVFYLSNFVSTIHVRLSENISTVEGLRKVEELCRSIAPEAPFEFNFADSDFDQKFAYEERVAKLASVFSVLAIIISCLGLFGMASFMTQRRTKEIGIRKVVGASVFNLWKMMSTEFVAIILLSFVIAAPVAWYSLDKWLQNFVYRTDVSWYVFAAAGGGALFVTLATVSFQLLKAAHRNPVLSLKTE